VANPLVIVHVVGGAHLDALLMVLAVVTVAAVGRRRWTAAAIAAACAFSLKLPGLVLVGYVLLRRARSGDPRRLWKIPAVAAGAALACAALVPGGWGWIAALSVPGKIRHPYDPSTILGWGLYLLARATGWAGSPAGAISVARALAMLAGAAGVLALLWRATASRPPRQAAALTGAALLTVAVAAPAVHAWYLAWGLALIAVGTGRARRWLAGLSAAMCFTALPEPGASPAGLVLTVGLAVAAVAVVYQASRGTAGGEMSADDLTADEFTAGGPAAGLASNHDERRATAGEAL
jgi:alpha-1,6-mannosyltransferase